MTLDDFKALRDLPQKPVADDMVFAATSNPTIFRSELKINLLGFDVVLDATYYDLTPSVVFNFRVIGNGAICRYCVNHTAHKDAASNLPTRTHKHSPRNDNCFNGQHNLPFANNRTDLVITDFEDIERIWQTICVEANIAYLGKVVKL